MQRNRFKKVLTLSAGLLFLVVAANAESLDPRLTNKQTDQVFQALTAKNYIARYNNEQITRIQKINALKAQIKEYAAHVQALEGAHLLDQQQISDLHSKIISLETEVADLEQSLIIDISHMSDEIARQVKYIEEVAASTKDDPEFQRAQNLIATGNSDAGLAALDSWKANSLAPVEASISQSKRLTAALEADQAAKLRAYAFARMGVVTTQQSIEDFEILTKAPGVVFDDWITLHELYELAERRTDDIRALKSALAMAPGSYFRIAYAGELAAALYRNNQPREALDTLKSALVEARTLQSPDREQAEFHLYQIRASMEDTDNGDRREDTRQAINRLGTLINKYHHTYLAEQYLTALDTFVDASDLSDSAQLQEAVQILADGDSAAKQVASMPAAISGPDSESLQGQLAFHNTVTAKVRTAQSDYPGAEVAALESQRIFKTLRQKKPNVGRYGINLEFVQGVLATAYYYAYYHGDVRLSVCYGRACRPVAISLSEEAILTGEQVVDQHPGDPISLGQLFTTYEGSIRRLRLLGEPEKVRLHFAEMHRRYRSAVAQHVNSKSMDDAMSVAQADFDKLGDN